MKIKKITSQIRRDFTAIYECEHCGNTETRDGYDDDSYRPLAPKYSENQVV